MSIPKTRAAHTDATVITCNGCGGQISCSNPDHEEARKQAARAGWTSVKARGTVRDFCRRCSSAV